MIGDDDAEQGDDTKIDRRGFEQLLVKSRYFDSLEEIAQKPRGEEGVGSIADLERVAAGSVARDKSPELTRRVSLVQFEKNGVTYNARKREDDHRAKEERFKMDVRNMDDRKE